MARPTDEEILAVAQRAKAMRDSLNSWDQPYLDAANSILALVEEVRSLRSDLTEAQFNISVLTRAVDALGNRAVPGRR